MTKNLVNVGLVLVALVWGNSAVAAPPVQKKKSIPQAQAQRKPSSTKCAEPTCSCEELTKFSNQCVSVLNPADGAPRDRHALKDCYVSMVQKRRDVLVSKSACATSDKAAQQIDELKHRLVEYEHRPKDNHVSSSRGLEGFGVDLLGHLNGNQRTPATSGN